jgi:EF hand
MRTIAYCVFALLVLPAAVLVGAQKFKKLQIAPRAEGEAPPVKPKKVKPAAMDVAAPAPADAEETKEAKKAAKWVAKFDRNGDGQLDENELPAKWRKEALLFDRDGDGKLDLSEVTDYLEAVAAEKQPKKAKKGPAEQADALPTIKAPEPGAVVYRPGRLPDGLPPWFKELDTDGDGQVGLYEWKAAGRDAGEFLEIDLNQDGFLTAEEVLRAKKAQAPAASPAK